MNKGVLIFAHNNREVDYSLLALIAGGLAKKHLNVPVSIVTDESTLEWIKQSKHYEKFDSVFDQLLLVERPSTDNVRRLSDGNTSQVVPFINANRYSAWDVTPYERTLLIDSDFLVFSDTLGNYWNVDQDIMIGHSMNDIRGDRAGVLDKRISETGIHMYWATTVMFTKNENSKRFFDLVEYVKQNYKYYADLFRFDPTQFRNDIAFSVAQHILNGFEENHSNALPPINTLIDKDILDIVNDKGTYFLVSNILDDKYSLARTTGVDVHVMNKQSIVRHSNELLDLI